MLTIKNTKSFLSNIMSKRRNRQQVAKHFKNFYRKNFHHTNVIK